MTAINVTDFFSEMYFDVIPRFTAISDDDKVFRILCANLGKDYINELNINHIAGTRSMLFLKKEGVKLMPGDYIRINCETWEEPKVYQIYKDIPVQYIDATNEMVRYVIHPVNM